MAPVLRKRKIEKDRKTTAPNEEGESWQSMVRETKHRRGARFQHPSRLSDLNDPPRQRHPGFPPGVDFRLHAHPRRLLHRQHVPLQHGLPLAEAKLPKDGWPAYYDGKQGRFVGKQAREHQTWSIAGYLVAMMMLEDPTHLGMVAMEEEKQSKPGLFSGLNVIGLAFASRRHYFAAPKIPCKRRGGWRRWRPCNFNNICHWRFNIFLDRGMEL
ncbi:hypothetical protein DM860_004002 [Cuscuta australis]|uniref:Alkaline/neutral invertase n=1 Tax=Cuscuta australis TaxID=267555 RepID=A0A328CWU7_9ASTE|nr:hypothetical protein DM860_004002 [Cuscuta australis]